MSRRGGMIHGDPQAQQVTIEAQFLLHVLYGYAHVSVSADQRSTSFKHFFGIVGCRRHCSLHEEIRQLFWRELYEKGVREFLSHIPLDGFVLNRMSYLGAVLVVKLHSFLKGFPSTVAVTATV